MNIRIPIYGLGLSAALLLQSCFTGVEVTPRITDRQVSRNVGSPTAEQTLLGGVGGEAPSEWRQGKPFIVTEGKLTVAYSPLSAANNIKPGDTLRFERFKDAVTLTGAEMTDVILRTPEGQQISHRIEQSPQAVKAIEGELTLPFLIELSTVEDARAILKGRDVWTATLQRYNPDGTSIGGRKFEKVKIDDVRAGNADYPLAVHFITPDGTHAMVYMAVSQGSHSVRRFHNLFSLSDPRKRYPDISDTNWNLITRGQVTTGMNMSECRLALGQPKEVERDAAYSGLIERWTYENGIFLLFKDGILTRFRR